MTETLDPPATETPAEAPMTETLPQGDGDGGTTTTDDGDGLAPGATTADNHGDILSL